MMSMVVLISQMLKIDNLKSFFLELLIHIYYLDKSEYATHFL